MTEQCDTPLTPLVRERTLRMIADAEVVIGLQRREFEAIGLSKEEIRRAIEPLIRYVDMLREDIATSAIG